MVSPRIVVLITHYNNLVGLAKSLYSISSNEPVDVLIVDDGSSLKPDEESLIKTFIAINNIIVLKCDKNMGPEYATNTGLQYILESRKYEFIARLDCADVCDPDRFKIQKEYLDAHQDVYMVGSWVTWVDNHYKPLHRYELPITHKEIKKTLGYKDPFIHPTIMFRVATLLKTGLYPTKYRWNEDTAFFYNVVQNFKTANIPIPLVQCVIDPVGITQTKYRKMRLTRIRFTLDTFSLQHPFSWTFGIVKNIICFILGNKIPTKIALIIRPLLQTPQREPDIKNHAEIR